MSYHNDPSNYRWELIRFLFLLFYFWMTVMTARVFYSRTPGWSLDETRVLVGVVAGIGWPVYWLGRGAFYTTDWAVNEPTPQGVEK